MSGNDRQDLLRRLRAMTAEAAAMIRRTNARLREVNGKLRRPDLAAPALRPVGAPVRPCPRLAENSARTRPEPPGMFLGPMSLPPREARRMD